MVESYRPNEDQGRERPYQEKTKADWRAEFERNYRSYYKGDFDRPNEDGTCTRVCAYELILDPLDQVERHSLLTVFALRAGQSGYKQALGPLVLPNVGYRDREGSRPLTAVQFFFEKPASPAGETTSQTGAIR